MRTIQIGEKQIGLKATPLALLYYKQSFKSDLIGDMLKMQHLENDLSEFDAVLILQIAWAMAKANEGVGKPFPSFESWVAELDGFDFSDTNLMNTIMAEAADGFFRRGSQTAAK